jgi:hypothetical protein
VNKAFIIRKSRLPRQAKDSLNDKASAAKVMAALFFRVRADAGLALLTPNRRDEKDGRFFYR